MARAVPTTLAEKVEGHLVFISSLTGKVGISALRPLLAATKFGLSGFAFALREDLQPHGVGVSIVSPGFMREAGMCARRRGGAAADDRHDHAREGRPGRRPRDQRNRNEITVAPLRQRFLAEIGYRHPEFAARLQRRGGAEQIAEDLAAGQSDKR